MKTSIYKFCVIALLMAFTMELSAQVGSTCANPHLISSLPFNQTGLSTQNTGDNYDAINGIPRQYMSGNDYVFKYTPSASGSIKITLSNTNAMPMVGGVGLYILNGCPDNVASMCLDSATANNNPSISSVSLMGGMSYYIIVSSIAPMFGNPYINFDIKVEAVGTSNNNDVGVIEVFGVSSGCQLGPDTIKAKVVNFGNFPVTTLTVAYRVNNGSEATKTIPLLASHDTATVIFTPPYNFSTAGTYSIKAYTKMMLDQDHSNDTTVLTITKIQPIATFPYLENFENSNGGWTHGGTSSSWQHGVANATKINDSNNGNKSWVTNLTGNHNSGENSYLYSPCFNFSTLLKPKIRFKIWYEGQMMVGSSTQIEYTKDDVNWTVIGQMGEPNWYNSFNGFSGSSQGWKIAEHAVDTLAGEPYVKFRVHFSAGFFGQDEGVAFDNFEIFDMPHWDAAITEITSPRTACGLGNEGIKMTLFNNGADTIHTMTIKINVNGNVSTETFNGTINPGQEYYYSTSNLFNFSTPGMYTITAYAILAGDTSHANDTAKAIVNSLQTVNTFPYFEDFESSGNTFITEGTNSSWQWGTPVKPVINHAFSGTKCWVTDLDSNYNFNENSYLVAPCFDFTSLVKPVVQFAIFLRVPSGFVGGNATLEVSTDQGNTWKIVTASQNSINWYNGTSGWSDTAQNWMVVKTTLDTLGGYPNVQLRIHFNGDPLGQNEGIAIDDFKVFDTPSKDLGVVAISAPNSGCGLTNNEPIKVKITNFGTAAQSNFPVSYKVNSGTFITETVATTVNPGDTISYTFTTTAQLGNPGSYTILAQTELAGDAITTNDSISKVVVNVPEISTFPYFENFENNNGNYTAAGNASSWAWGTPAGQIINTAASGTKAWVTNLTGNHNANENSWIISPCFDLSSLTLPTLELAVWYKTPTLASVTVEYSKDAGATWNVIPRGFQYSNWYGSGLTNGWTGNSNGWIYARTTLDTLVGATDVIFRIHYNSGLGLFGQDEGVAIDNIKIFEFPPNDLGVISITEPTSNCGLSNNESLTVKIKNFATATQSNFTVGYKLNNNPVVTETANITVAPGDTAIYTFTHTLNLATPGTYTIKAFTMLTGDLIQSNDTASKTVTSTPEISTFPYSQNFESGNGFWTPGGTNSSWEYGVPAGTIINSASSGSNVWATNLDGNYTTNENSWLRSPCFNFTNLANPVIYLKLWREIGSFITSGYLRLESSIDGGNTWVTVGQNGDSLNWYNSTNGWNGSSGGWFLASHKLTGLGGKPNVLLRFLFNGGGVLSSASEGVAIDDILIRDECTAPIANFTQTITGGNTVAFTNLSSNATSYLWNFGDGSTSTQTNPTHVYTTTGTFNVKLKATNTCGSDSITKSLTITGISEINTMADFAVYPNPASEKITVVLPAVTAKSTIQLFNSLGQSVFAKEINPSTQAVSFEINVEQLEKGIYLMTITNQDLQLKRKIVIE